FPVGVCPVRPAPRLDSAVRHEGVLDVEPRPYRVVLILDEQIHITRLPPESRMQMVQKIFEHHWCVENEPPSRFERRPHCPQEGCVSFIVKVAESVAHAEDAVE